MFKRYSKYGSRLSSDIHDMDPLQQKSPYPLHLFDRAIHHYHQASHVGCRDQYQSVLAIGLIRVTIHGP